MKRTPPHFFLTPAVSLAIAFLIGLPVLGLLLHSPGMIVPPNTDASRHHTADADALMNSPLLGGLSHPKQQHLK